MKTRKQETMQAVRGGLIALLQDKDFKDSLCTLVWEHLFKRLLTREEDIVETVLFNECYNELVEQIKTCLKVAT